MSITNLLSQFNGYTNGNSATTQHACNDALGSLVSNLPNGLVGGAAAGSIMALLLGSKSTRRMVGKVAGYGGTALLGGLAYKAFKNWHNDSQQEDATTVTNDAPIIYDKGMVMKSMMTQDFEIKLIKVMIASVKADGHIDSIEQNKIFQAIDHMDLSIEIRAALFNLLNKPIDIVSITRDVEGLQQKSELYLAACLVTQPEHPENKQFLDQLAVSLGLPDGLQQQITLQAKHALREVN